MTRLIWIVTSLSCLLLKTCQPYSMGAPDQACKRMTPGHGEPPQEGDPPVKLEISSTDDIPPGGSVDLRLVGADSDFKGFILQARNSDGSETPLGHFETEEASYMTCGKGIHNSITHRNSDPKSSVQARWKAPADFEGEIFFRFSTVIEYSTFWTNKDSQKIRVTRNAPQDPIDSPAVPETTTVDAAAESKIIFPGDQEVDVALDSATPVGELQESTQSTEINEPVAVVTSTTSPPTTTRTTTTTTTTTSEPEVEAVHVDHEIFEGCGKSKVCFGMPVDCIDNGDCSTVVSYELSRDEMLFKLVGKSDGYVAVGLSYDGRMGEDLTAACYYNPNNGEVSVQSGYNRGYSNIPLHHPKLGINDFSGSYDDGFIDCQFKRPLSVKIEEDGGRVFQLLEDKYVIFVAQGPFSDGRLLKHAQKLASSEPQALGIVTKLQSDPKLYLRLHGAFMIGAWIFSASLGILLARYFKQTWTTTKCCSLDQWFVFHRIFMVITWLLTMAGFILIFIELDLQWTAIPIQENPHAVLGCITTGLCFIQPFMALLRCHPGTPRRPIFNWLHWFVGNAAHIVGIVAIFFAVDLSKADLPKETDYLLIAFVAFHFLMHLTLSVMMCVSERQKKVKGKYHPNGNGGYPLHHMGYGYSRGMPPVHPYPDYEELKGDAPGSLLRKFFLAVYIIVAGLVAAALIALVVLAPARKLLQDAGILS